jgi:hypothetical protein
MDQIWFADETPSKLGVLSPRPAAPFPALHTHLTEEK